MTAYVTGSALNEANFFNREFRKSGGTETKLNSKYNEVIYLREHIEELRTALIEANDLLSDCPASEKWSDGNIHLMWPPDNTCKE